MINIQSYAYITTDYPKIQKFINIDFENYSKSKALKFSISVELPQFLSYKLFSTYSSFNKFVEDGYYEKDWCNFKDKYNINELDYE